MRPIRRKEEENKEMNPVLHVFMWIVCIGGIGLLIAMFWGNWPVLITFSSIFVMFGFVWLISREVQKAQK